MSALVRDAEHAGPDDLVLEVHRVEDARTVTQRLYVPAGAWRTFLDMPSSASPADAYEARRDFWEWLAEGFAETAPGTPSAGVEAGTRTVDASWLDEKHAAWQSRA